MKLSIPTLLLAVALSLLGVSSHPSPNAPFEPRSTHLSSAFHRYPPPVSHGGAWRTGYRKAKHLVAQMTIEEKVNITTGFTGKCVGFTGEVPRLDLQGICLADGPAGVRPARRVSQFPAGITVAATWNRSLIVARAEALADEFKNKGVNVWLGPVTGGPLGRSPRGGRNWEGFGPDEYLNGEASYLSVKHAQKNGLVACAKHWLAYEQETGRSPYNNSEPYSLYPGIEQQPISSNLDDRTTHELYMWPFAEAVRAGAGSLMCAYNRVNGTNACGDPYSQNHLLKTELNFQGAVISDWGGTWSTLESALGGMDVSMPGGAYSALGLFGDFYGAELVALVRNGSVSEARLDDMAVRMLAPVFELQGNLSSWPPISIDVRDDSVPTNDVRSGHADVIRTIGEESLTLLKNERRGGRGLPLKSVRQLQALAIIGQDAGPKPDGWTSCGQGGTCERDANNGTLSLGGGSGWVIPPYISDPLSAITQHVRYAGPQLNVALNNWNTTNAILQANVSDTALVFVNAWATEGQDRQNLSLWANGDQLIKDVAGVNNDTVVVIHASGPVLVEEWIEHPNVTAVLFAYYPGQEAGASLLPILWGERSPSGKLPFTMAKRESDWPPHTIAPINGTLGPQANFTEKLLVDYKWFDAKNITPRFPFGHGLSYSNFTYGALSISPTFRADNTSVQRTSEPFSATHGSSLYDVLYTARVGIHNTGTKRAAEVAQLYISLPTYINAAPKLLRGFQKLDLAAGEHGTASFELRRKDISFWDTRAQSWVVPQGGISVLVGASSRDIRAQTMLHVE